MDHPLGSNVAWFCSFWFDQPFLDEAIKRSVDERTANGEDLPNGAGRRKIARNSKTVLRPLGEQSQDGILG